MSLLQSGPSSSLQHPPLGAVDWNSFTLVFLAICFKSSLVCGEEKRTQNAPNNHHVLRDRKTFLYLFSPC